MRNMPDIWVNCRAVLTICNNKTTVCGLVWKENRLKTYEGAATLHPQLSKIKARSLSGQTTTTQQRMTSYLLVAPRFQICYLQSIMWRPSQGRGPHVVPADPSSACLAECGENSAEKGDSQNTPLKMYPRGRREQHHHLHSGTPPLELHQPHICLHPLLFEDRKICCPPYWASTS